MPAKDRGDEIIAAAYAIGQARDARREPPVVPEHALEPTDLESRKVRQARWEARFRGAWASVAEYRTMVGYALAEFREGSRTFAAGARATIEAMKSSAPGPRPLTDDEAVDLAESREEALRLRYHEESVYMFGNVLLDRAAMAVKMTLFSASRSAPPSKHSELVSELPRIAAEAGLSPPSEQLMALANRLETEFSEVRDRKIVHQTDGDTRLSMARSFHLDSDETSLFPVIMHPTPKESAGPPAQPLATGELAACLDEYLLELIGWARSNLPADAA